MKKHARQKSEPLGRPVGNLRALNPDISTLAGALERVASILAQAGVEGPREEARHLYCGLTDCSQADVVRGDMGAPSSSEWAELLSWAERRAQGEPLAYLEGKVGFYGLEFKVDSRVLIPRPDSECLVEAGLASLQGKESPRILDLGTGSGCLLLATLAHHQTALGIGVDRDPGALEVASENAEVLGLRSRVSFRMGNWFDGLAAKPFDLILCNPPYVQPGEELGLGVEEFEPAMALFTPPDDPFWCYREILESAAPFLGAESLLILEVGFGRMEDVEACVVAHGFRVAGVHLDLAKVPRALSVGL